MQFLSRLSESFYFNIAELPAVSFLILFCPLLYLILKQKHSLLSTAAIYTFHIIVIFWMLLGAWKSLTFPSVHMTSNIPFSDAKNYLEGALSWLSGTNLSSVSSRRPEYALFLAGILRLTELDFSTAQVALSLLVGLSLAALCITLQNKISPFVAAIFSCFFILYYRPLINFNGTEQLGISLGLIATNFILQSKLFFGFFLLSLGLFSRAGTFFMIPTLLIWAFRNRSSYKDLAAPIIGLLIAGGLHATLIQTTTIEKPAMTSNFWYVAYGVAAGNTGWDSIYNKLPNLRNEKDERVVISEIRNETLSLISERPSHLAIGIIKIYKEFLENMFLFAKWSAPKISPLSAPLINGVWLALLIFLLLIGLIKNSAEPKIKSLFWLAALGIFISIPFLPPRDSVHMRTYCVSYSFLILPLALGIDYIFRKLRIVSFEKITSALTRIFHKFPAADRLPQQETYEISGLNHIKTAEIFLVIVLMSTLLFGIISRGSYQVLLKPESPATSKKCDHSSSLSLSLIRIPSLISPIVAEKKQSSFEITLEEQKSQIALLREVHQLPFIGWDQLKSGSKLALFWDSDQSQLRWVNFMESEESAQMSFCNVVGENTGIQLLLPPRQK